MQQSRTPDFRARRRQICSYFPNFKLIKNLYPQDCWLVHENVELSIAVGVDTAYPLADQLAKLGLKVCTIF
jgi:hypothetical protein